MKRTVILTVLTAAIMFGIPATAENGELEKYKAFDEVFGESISTDIDAIGYGMVVFAGLNPYAANLDEDDLQLILDEYKNLDGERIEAPYNNLGFEGFYYEQPEKEYFYIGLSAELPYERWNWRKTVRMTGLFFGGGQTGDVMYGGFGRRNSEYGEDFPKPASSCFIWYRPHDEEKERIAEIGKYIYDKYKPLAKPFGDYDGTQDESLFSGYDGVWETMFYLPDCLNTDGSSEWAEYTLQLAALEGLFTYEQARNYTAPVTRLEFCNLMARLLNKIPRREDEDYFKNQYGYTVLGNKVDELGLTEAAENIRYNDVSVMTDDIRYISAIGLMQGLGNGDFAPDYLLTREQICAVFDRMFELYDNYKSYRVADDEIGDNKFNDDTEISDWAKKSVYKLQKSGFVSGYDNNYFAPKDYCTKEQVISIIYRVLQGCEYR